MEDEDQFKRVTEELKEMCKNLMMNKADKIALIEINERLGAAKLLQEQVEDVRQELIDKVRSCTRTMAEVGRACAGSGPVQCLTCFLCLFLGV